MTMFGRLYHCHHHWAPVVYSGCVKTSACRLHVNLPCAALRQVVSLRYFPSRLSTVCVVFLVAFCCCMVSKWWHVRVVGRQRRLLCPAEDHLIPSTLLIMARNLVISLTQVLVFLSLYVMSSIRTSMLVDFCASLASVNVSAPYVIAGGMQELYTCLSRQNLARLSLKKCRCLCRQMERLL